MSKRLIVLYVFLILIVIIITLACTVFTVSGIQVIPAGNIALTEVESEKIISDSGINLKSSVFTLSKSKASTNIELQNPTMKVTKVEVKFPNKVVINVRRRLPVFITTAADKYVVLDRELKIIDMIDSKEGIDYCFIDGFDLAGVEISTVITTNVYWLISLISGAESMSYINNRFYTFIPKITYNNGEIYLTTNLGVTFVLSESGDVAEQFINCYQYFSQYVMNNYSSGYIYMSESGWTYNINYNKL